MPDLAPERHGGVRRRPAPLVGAVRRSGPARRGVRRSAVPSAASSASTSASRAESRATRTAWSSSERSPASCSRRGVVERAQQEVALRR